MDNNKLLDDWKKSKLKEITEIITKGTTPTTIGYNYTKEGVNFVKIESITNAGEFLIDKMAHISEECNDRMIRSQLKENDIVFSIAGAIGRTAMVNKEILPANTNQALAIIRLNTNEVSTEFLLKYLRSECIFKQFEKKKQGVAQLNLSLKDISELEIMYPSMLEQKKIVAILNRAQKAINMRKESIKLLDELVKSKFVEMFGTPLGNRFKGKTLPEIVSEDKYALKRGPFGGSLKKDDFVKDGYLVYEQRHAIHNDFDYAKYYISKEKYEEMIMFKVEPKDLLVSCSGVTLGRISEVPEGAKAGIINQALLKITLNQNIMNNVYFINLFRNEQIQDKLFGFSRGSGIPNFPSMNEVKSIKFLCPPIQLQNEFADFVNQVDKLKIGTQKSLEEMENNFSSLMQRAFKGELFL